MVHACFCCRLQRILWWEKACLNLPFIAVDFRHREKPVHKTMWKKIEELVLSPKIEEASLRTQLQKAKAGIPTPVFWLLGKTQSGKSSIIRALTGDSRAQIGDGMRPVTRTAYLYDFPNEESCLIKFLDTRGLGETDYDPAEDMSTFQGQAHVLVVVMKAMDHAQGKVMKSVRTILKKQPHWPVIVVQTCLHEGYSDPAMNHVLPYPYDDPNRADSVPTDLRRALDHQRRLLKGIDARFVAVDFTLKEDGYDPVLYGLDAFWRTIEETLPHGIVSVLRDAHDIRSELEDFCSKAAFSHILAYAILSGAAGAIPLPLIDIPLVTLIQAKLLHSIASIYNYPLNRERIKTIGSALGLSLAANIGRRQLVKLIPVYGSGASSLLTAASTYALGKTLGAYMLRSRQGGAVDPKIFQEIYAAEFEQGRRLLKRYLGDLSERKSAP
jgi:uncharacterized protein (DUF697 family)